MQGPKNLSISSKCILVMVLVNSHAQSLWVWIKVLEGKSLTQLYLILLEEHRTFSRVIVMTVSMLQLFLLFPFSSVLQQWTEFNLECFTYLLSSKLLPAIHKTCMIQKRGQSVCSYHIPYSWFVIIFLSLRILVCVSSMAVGVAKLFLCSVLHHCWCPVLLFVTGWGMDCIIPEGQGCGWREFVSSKYWVGLGLMSGIQPVHKKHRVMFASFIWNRSSK